MSKSFCLFVHVSLRHIVFESDQSHLEISIQSYSRVHSWNISLHKHISLVAFRCFTVLIRSRRLIKSAEWGSTVHPSSWDVHMETIQTFSLSTGTWFKTLLPAALGVKSISAAAQWLIEPNPDPWESAEMIEALWCRPSERRPGPSCLPPPPTRSAELLLGLRESVPDGSVNHMRFANASISFLPGSLKRSFRHALPIRRWFSDSPAADEDRASRSASVCPSEWWGKEIGGGFSDNASLISSSYDTGLWCLSHAFWWFCKAIDVLLYPRCEWIHKMNVNCKDKGMDYQWWKWVSLACVQEAVGGESFSDHTAPQPGGETFSAVPPLSHAAFWYCKAWTNMIGMPFPPLLSLFL